MVQNPIDQCGRFRPYPQLKIPPAIGLCSKASASQISAAQVHRPAINDDRLGVQTRTAADRQVARQSGFQLPQRGIAGRARVEQADFDAALGQAAQRRNDADPAPTPFLRNDHRLEISGCDVEADLGPQDAAIDDPAEMFGVGDEQDISGVTRGQHGQSKGHALDIGGSASPGPCAGENSEMSVISSAEHERGVEPKDPASERADSDADDADDQCKLRGSSSTVAMARRLDD
jgi:hypothetical protein